MAGIAKGRIDIVGAAHELVGALKAKGWVVGGPLEVWLDWTGAIVDRELDAVVVARPGLLPRKDAPADHLEVILGDRVHTMTVRARDSNGERGWDVEVALESSAPGSVRALRAAVASRFKPAELACREWSPEPGEGDAWAWSRWGAQVRTLEEVAERIVALVLK